MSDAHISGCGSRKKIWGYMKKEARSEIEWAQKKTIVEKKDRYI